MNSARQNASRSTSGPRPAAAVAFVRDAAGGIEIYLSRRPAHFRYFPGAFVFPGGRAETDDADMKATACREVKEEIGVDIDPGRLALLRETHTAAHAGPVYHLFFISYSPAESMRNLRPRSTPTKSMKRYGSLLGTP